jgi:tellurite resistance protein TerA
MALLLTKENARVPLRKGEGIMTVTLRWSSQTDVDLACIWETIDGKTGVIQALDRNYGSLTEAPYISLDGDARSGGVEVLKIDLGHADLLKRAMVFAFVYEGGSWHNVRDATVTVDHPTQGEFLVELKGQRFKHTCALVDLQATHPGGPLALTREEVYFVGYHQALDRHYRWPNINWTSGHKD